MQVLPRVCVRRRSAEEFGQRNLARIRRIGPNPRNLGTARAPDSRTSRQTRSFKDFFSKFRGKRLEEFEELQREDFQDKEEFQTFSWFLPFLPGNSVKAVSAFLRSKAGKLITFLFLEVLRVWISAGPAGWRPLGENEKKNEEASLKMK